MVFVTFDTVRMVESSSSVVCHEHYMSIVN